MTLRKKYLYSLFAIIMFISGVVIVNVNIALAVSSTCSYSHRQLAGSSFKTIATGSVTINHNITIVGGAKASYNIGDIIDFAYNWDGSFQASGGYWDTPIMLKTKSINNARQSFIANYTNYPNYTQRISDNNGNAGYIRWYADENSNYGILSVNSSDKNIVTCSGTRCTVVGSGNVNLTVTVSSVWARLSAVTYRPDSNEWWFSSEAPEGYINVPNRGYILGNSTLTNGCTIRNMKDWYLRSGNYKGIKLPSKTQDFSIVVSASTTAPIANLSISGVTSNPPNLPSATQGDTISFTGTSSDADGDTIAEYIWKLDGNGTYNNGTTLENKTTSSETQTYSSSSFSAGTHKMTYCVLYAGGSWNNSNYTDCALVDFTVNPPIIAPTVDLKINNSDSPITVLSGDSLNIKWNVNNATSCTASGAGWTGSKNPAGGLDTITASTSSLYVLTCTGPGGSGSDNVKVNICTPSYTYNCITNDSVDCSNPNNCAKNNIRTNQCIALDNTGSSCVGSAVGPQPLSVCETNGVTCPSTTTTVSCSACPNESNWIEVMP